MKARTIPFVVALAAAVTLVGCGGETTMPMQGTAEDDATIRGIADRYVAAYNANDAAGIAALVADDYEAVAPDGTMVRGKAGVEKTTGMEMQMMEKMNVDTTLSASLDFLHWLNAESATVGGSWTMAGLPEGQPDRGSWMAVMHKSPDGQWLVTSDLTATYLPPPPAEAEAAPAK